MKKETLLHALAAFARQRPGMDPANYGDWRAYRREAAGITRDLHDAETLIQAVSWRDSVTAEAILEAARTSFCGRLSIEIDESGAVRIDYCTGQYFPTEYRRAVCTVMAGALWESWRADLQPIAYRVSWAGKSGANSREFKTRDAAQELAGAIGAASGAYVDPVYLGGMSAGDRLRKIARDELGRSIAARYFN